MAHGVTSADSEPLRSAPYALMSTILGIQDMKVE